MRRVIAALREITKAYPGIVACRKVSVELLAGEIHALVGENGAGKTTLVKILGGLLRPDTGWMELDGRAVHFRNPSAAKRAGVGVVHQAGSLIETMTVAENLALGTSGRPRSDGDRVGLWTSAVGGERLVRELSPRERRLVEIEKCLQGGARVLVLDEPTATLAPQESEALFQTLRAIADTGCAIVVVSHKLPEVLTHADRFTVLRKGQVVARLARNQVSGERLVQLLTSGPEGVDVSMRPTEDRASAATAKTPLLRISALCTASNRSTEAPLQGVDLVLDRGEVVSLAGRPGSGLATLLPILYGDCSAVAAGCVKWFDASGKDSKDPPRAIGVIPADRLRAGLVGEFNIAENLALRRRDLLGWRHALSRRKALHAFAAQLMRRFGIEPPDQRMKVSALSGGNLQKVLLARELDYAQELLVAVSPTAGLDAATTAVVRQALRKKAAGGTCVVVLSDDLDELVSLADRIVVFSRGRVITELTGDQLTAESLGLALAEVSFPTGVCQEQRCQCAD